MTSRQCPLFDFWLKGKVLATASNYRDEEAGMFSGMLAKLHFLDQTFPLPWKKDEVSRSVQT